MTASRTNLEPNPSFEYGVGGWSFASGATGVVDATKKHSGNQSMKVSRATTGGMGCFTTAGQIVPTPGITYIASAWLNIPAGTFNQFASISLVYYSSSLAVLGTSLGQTIPANVGNGGVWTRYSATGTAPAGTAYMLCQAWNSQQANGGTVFWLDDVLVEVGNTLGTYFDGDTADDASYTYAWSGTPGASSSVATPVAAPPPSGSRFVNVGGASAALTHKSNVDGAAAVATRTIKVA